MKKQNKTDKKVISIVGARPQFVKLACLAPTLDRAFKHLIVHTGQHYDNLMSDIFFDELKIPRINYNLKAGPGNHADMTGTIMIKLEKLLLRLKPDMVLVYGDTNSTLAGALTAAKMHIPVGHIEAGLRSFDMTMPEEINRRVTDHVSSLLLAPTAIAIKNLKNEGIDKSVVRSGDLMYQLIDEHRNYLDGNRGLIERFKLIRKEYLLATIHRAANVDDADNLGRIINILEKLKYPILFPIHPRTLKYLKKHKLLNRLKRISHCTISQPLSYLDNLTLICHARAVLTDSGGVQKESLFLKTPCLTLRNETEWVETLKWGNHLVGLSYSRIIAALKKSSEPIKRINYKINHLNPTEIIVKSILGFLKG